MSDFNEIEPLSLETFDPCYAREVKRIKKLEKEKERIFDLIFFKLSLNISFYFSLFSFFSLFLSFFLFLSNNF